MDPTGGKAAYILIALIIAIVFIWVVLPFKWAVGISVFVALVVLIALASVFSDANYH